MGIVYFIRHGQRFPLKRFPLFKSAFGDEPEQSGELTETGRSRMKQLGTTFKDLPIVKAKFSGVRRCEESLEEFLSGAENSVRGEPLGDENFVNMQDFFENCDVTAVADAFNANIRNRKALDEITEEYLPGLEPGFIRDCVGGALIDALNILDDRGIQKMTSDAAGLDLDFTVSLTLSLRKHFGDAIRKTIAEAFENGDGDTVALVSDMHLIYILQRVAPILIHGRPPFGSILKITPSDERVTLDYQDHQVEVPRAEFRRRMELDVPLSHF